MITKRKVATHSSDIDGRIHVKEYNQVIELDDDGQFIRLIESIPEISVIDPSMGDYDAKVKALGKKLVGSLANSQEGVIRDEKSKCKKHLKKIAMLEKVVKAQESKIAELQKED